jgi:hypothetical protein
MSKHNDETLKKVLDGLRDPKENNPEHKKALKRANDKRVAVTKGIIKARKNREKYGDAIDTGMFDN